MRIIPILMAAAFLSGCSQSVDDRFSAFCEEQKNAGPHYAKLAAGPCEYADQLSPEQKEQLMKLRAAVETATERARDSGAVVDENGEVVSSDTRP